MITNRITKRICPLYSKLSDETYQLLGDGFLVNLGQDECLIVSASIVKNQGTIYAKLDEKYIPFNVSDWTFLLDIAIAKFNQVKKPKDKNKEETFTQNDFQNALKKVSRKVTSKKEKKDLK